MDAADMGVSKADRLAEKAKYDHCYTQSSYNYAMGGVRKLDAIEDLRWAFEQGARSYLDIGCGRGEMLEIAERIGFERVYGTDIADALIVPGRVEQCFVHELDRFADGEFDLVTSFDVIEHLHPGDDETLVRHLGRIAATHLALTANNKRSIDPTTGADLHINKRPYDEWDRLIREWLPGRSVERCAGKQYVSETWRAS